MVGVNAFNMDTELEGLIVNHDAWRDTPVSWTLPGEIQGVVKIDDLVPPEITSLLRLTLDAHHWLAVGRDGMADKPVELVGNYRLSNYNPALAECLWQRIKNILPRERSMTPQTPTDHDNHTLWRPIGVSPLLRFIRYREGGELVAHYDATYRESDEHRTLMSLVIYLTSNQRGATRFIRDDQAGRAMDDMDFRDWDRVAHEDEVIYRNVPRPGEALMFDHRLLHDGEPLAHGDSEKIIIRTDIMFEKIHG